MKMNTQNKMKEEVCMNGNIKEISNDDDDEDENDPNHFTSKEVFSVIQPKVYNKEKDGTLKPRPIVENKTIAKESDILNQNQPIFQKFCSKQEDFLHEKQSFISDSKSCNVFPNIKKFEFDPEICFESKFPLPELIKSILREKKLCGEDWSYYEKINEHLKLLYGQYKKKYTISPIIHFLEMPPEKAPENNELYNIAMQFPAYLKIKNDENSFYRAVGLSYMVNWFFSFKRRKSLPEKQIYQIIEKLSEKKIDYQLKICKGFCNMDIHLAILLEKVDFLTSILTKFLCLFIHKNFEIREEIREFLPQKQKLWEFIIGKINEYPILDIALIVFMKSWLMNGFDKKIEVDKEIIKTNIFGKEPNLDYLERICKKNKIRLFLIDIESNDEKIKIYNSKKEENINIEINLCYYQESFKLIYNKVEANNIYDYDNRKISDYFKIIE